MAAGREQKIGIAYGLSAYLWWGFVALYFKVVAETTPLELLVHRIVWSWLLLVAGLLIRGRGREFIDLFRHRRTFLTMQGTTLLIALNWLVFIWAITNDRVLEASLGYFINPLVNVLLGFLFLGERLRWIQGAAVLLAALGVLWLSLSLGAPPYVALVLAFSFGLYGLLRKIARPSGVQGLAAETTLLLPLALTYFVWLWCSGDVIFGQISREMDLLLMASGLITALPLVWFAEAARRLRYATVGFLQFIAPSLQFVLAVVVFHEPFTRAHMISFALIWSALVLFSWDSLRCLRFGPATAG